MIFQGHFLLISSCWGSLNFTTCSRWFEEGYNIEQPKIYGVLAVLREIGFTNMKNYHLDLYLPGGLSGNFFFCLFLVPCV